jgi:hypothetical protein
MKDLKIDNYDFQDLLLVFKVDINQPLKFQMERRKKKLEEKTLDKETLTFYQKVFAILSSIGELSDQSFILDINDDECIYNYIDKIKKVEDYHTKDPTEILHHITSQSFLLEKGIHNINSHKQDISFSYPESTNCLTHPIDNLNPL